jgi:hypothetical protein
MDESDVTHFKLAKFARYLGRISVATRVIGIIIVVGAILAMLFAILQLFSGRHEEDAIGVFVVALGVGGIGTVIWSAGVFHGAMAHALVVFGWIDGKLWEVMRLLKERPSPLPVSSPPAAVVAAAPTPEVLLIAPAEVAPAGAAAPNMPADAAVAESSASAQESSALPVAAAASSAKQEPEPASAPQEMKICKHCSAEIPANVLRCKYCLERV